MHYRTLRKKYFSCYSAFGLNSEISRVNLHNQNHSECGKTQTGKTPNTGTLHAEVLFSAV